MTSFSTFINLFEERLKENKFPKNPQTLYTAAEHILSIGGKRIRPVCVLMANELFGEILEDAFQAALAIELFHNFSLIHDDMMDKAPLRRGKPTVHELYGNDVALLAGDVMLVKAYEALAQTHQSFLPELMKLFNNTAQQVCEGQQLDMDFENRDDVDMEEYEMMITQKTSVLLGCSLQMGAIIGGAGKGNQEHLYAFGKNLGIAFQVQDDYLDAFGNPQKVGKQIGGDILANKKTFLLIRALQTAAPHQKQRLDELLKERSENKVDEMLNIFKDCKVEEWAMEAKEKFYQKALFHLEEVAVLSSSKEELLKLAAFLMHREN